MSGPDIEAIATAFRRSAYNAYLNTLIGNPPEIVKKAYKRMKTPCVGDWVIEESSVYRTEYTGESDLDGLGVLEEIAEEPVDFGDPSFVWDEGAEGRPHPTERVYYLRTLDGRRFRWVNASVVAIPTWLP